MDVNDEKRLLITIIGKQTVDIAIYLSRIQQLEENLAASEQTLQMILAAKEDQATKPAE